jgi:hypothetical protein
MRSAHDYRKSNFRLGNVMFYDSAGSHGLTLPVSLISLGTGLSQARHPGPDCFLNTLVLFLPLALSICSPPCPMASSQWLIPLQITCCSIALFYFFTVLSLLLKLPCLFIYIDCLSSSLEHKLHEKRTFSRCAPHLDLTHSRHVSTCLMNECF